jgi:hypothetical protein
MNRLTFATRRDRLWYTLLIMLVTIAGLASRRYPLLPDILGKYPGDALWTMMMFLLCAICLPRAGTFKLAMLALFISYVVEFGQLYQAAWIVAIRQTTIGHLILGSHFAWADLVAYTIGAAIAFVIERSCVTLRSTER